MSGTTEAALSRSIRSALEGLGHWVIRVPAGKFTAVSSGRTRHIHCAEPGTPDLHVLDVGLWLEVKTPKGKLSAAQRAWHEKAARRFVRVAVVRSVAEAVAAVRGRA